MAHGNLSNIIFLTIVFCSTLFILEKIPTARNMFSFLKDSVEVQNSLKLQAHAEKKFGMVCDSAAQL
ncbi:hypothetical protein MtrunA17_Chr7g0270491 [Medicago truncatula]|uniref:Uncharacterized protein n=1 Tax=Medicago truncatula TaxID=3880 RepID=A0A396H738_MEDTR|nr:hypothetical protein MtrunA17_Chr7g0270491 [Medicago truncatula]